jgi:membrane protein implicated in regulation of membrane protease activity
MLWQVWWVWVAGGFLLGVLEVLAPGFIFLGFALGAVLTGIVVALGLSHSLAPLILAFAVLSVLSWLGLRAAFGRHPGQVKLWDRDINDN